MMPKIEKVDDIIATRELVYVSDSGEREKATVTIGRPYEIDKDTYVCPYKVGSASYEHMFGSVGIDTFQALQLCLRSIESELVYWVRRRGGSFEYLGEPGTGLEQNDV
jgi:hypothetical protein